MRSKLAWPRSTGIAFPDCGPVLTPSRAAAAATDPDDPNTKTFIRMRRSAQYLADNFEAYPLLLFGFSQHDTSGSSIYPAIWNAMLAARGEGVGSALTSLMAQRAKEVLDILGVPEGEGWIMSCCITLGYPTGRWGVAERIPAEQVSFSNRWGSPLPFEVKGPLWP